MTARVLVVDDILSNVKLLEAKLTAEYFEVVTAFNGMEALGKIEECDPDIVLLDVMMPGMDGFEVCRRIKSNPKTAHVPVVMVTALDQPSDRVAGLEAGADDFLTKPVDDSALFARVRSLVRLKMMTDELAHARDDRPEHGSDRSRRDADRRRRRRAASWSSRTAPNPWPGFQRRCSQRTKFPRSIPSRKRWCGCAAAIST